MHNCKSGLQSQEETSRSKQQQCPFLAYPGQQRRSLMTIFVYILFICLLMPYLLHTNVTVSILSMHFFQLSLQFKTGQNNQMIQSPTQNQQDRELSKKFYKEVPQLMEIEQRFPTDAIGQQLQRRDIQNQFELIRAITETKKHKQGLRVCEGMESRKNRYPEQSIYDHSRVCIRSEGRRGQQGSNYINANIVFGKERKAVGKGVMIITQGPLEATTSDFNQMLRMYEITCVVMLCRTVENGKPRCFDYPNSEGWNKIDNYRQHHLQVTKVKINGLQNQVTHLYFPNWPDKGVPEDPAELDELIAAAKLHQNIVIHCSAGLGRSGVVASILQEIVQEETLKQGISVFETVRLLRQSRFGAVQNNQQYRLIYEYLQRYFTEFV